MIEPPIFESNADRADFCRRVIVTYSAVLDVMTQAGEQTGSLKRTVLMIKLLLKMLTYKEVECDRLVSGETVAKANKEAAALWPLLQAWVDADLDEARREEDNEPQQAN